MGFDANGKWTSDFYPITDRDNGVAILASKFQTLIQTNLKQSFENCILRDGTGKPTSSINWNGQKITNLATGTSAADAVNKEQMDSAIAAASWAKTDFSNITDEAKALFVPVGSLQMAPLTSLEGYLLCNGQAVSRSTYANLFDAIGVNFGVGDGITTFNVPDYRGCFLRGFGGDSELDMYTKQNTALPNINGTFTAYKGGYAGGGTASGAFSISSDGSVGGSQAGEGGPATKATFNAHSYSSVYQDGVSEARPVNYAVNFFIKY